MCLSIVYVVCSLFISNAVSLFMDSCEIYPNGYVTENETEIQTVPLSCLSGTVDWPYPTGKLELNFKQKVPFKLCLKEWIAGRLLTIFDNSHGEHKQIKVLSSDTNQCIESNGLNAVLEIKGPEYMMYVAGFAYKINLK